MNALKLAAFAVLMTCGTGMAQEVEKKMEFKIVVDSDGTDQPNVMTWSGAGEDLENLAVGESKTLQGDSGNEVVVTRTASGMEFNVNGETVVVPNMGQHGTTMAFVDAESMHEIHGDIDVDVLAIDGNETVDVHVVKSGTRAIPVHSPEGVTIISDKVLDDSVRESIKSVLISAGHDDEVRFIDGSEDNSHVRVIRKRVEIQQ